jgi:hypothetical protein
MQLRLHTPVLRYRSRQFEVLLHISEYATTQANGLRKSRFRTMGLLTLGTSRHPSKILEQLSKMRTSSPLVCALAIARHSISNNEPLAF